MWNIIFGGFVSLLNFVGPFSKQLSLLGVICDWPKEDKGYASKKAVEKIVQFIWNINILICVVLQPSATTLKQSVKDRLGPLMPENSEPIQDSSVASQVCVDGPLIDVVSCIYMSKSTLYV